MRFFTTLSLLMTVSLSSEDEPVWTEDFGSKCNDVMSRNQRLTISQCKQRCLADPNCWAISTTPEGSPHGALCEPCVNDGMYCTGCDSNWITLHRPEQATSKWQTIAILKGSQIPPVNAIGDLSNCPDYHCKLSDDAINALGFSILKFEPVPTRYTTTPVTYFDFTGRTFDSQASVGACSTPWTLNEADALSGQFDGSETGCCDYNVCNFGVGHCGGTVKSSYGFLSYGGCGEHGPIIGTSGVQLAGVEPESSLRISVYITETTHVGTNCTETDDDASVVEKLQEIYCICDEVMDDGFQQDEKHLSPILVTKIENLKNVDTSHIGNRWLTKWNHRLQLKTQKKNEANDNHRRLFRKVCRVSRFRRNAMLRWATAIDASIEN